MFQWQVRDGTSQVHEKLHINQGACVRVVVVSNVEYISYPFKLISWIYILKELVCSLAYGTQCLYDQGQMLMFRGCNFCDFPRPRRTVELVQCWVAINSIVFEIFRCGASVNPWRDTQYWKCIIFPKWKRRPLNSSLHACTTSHPARTWMTIAFYEMGFKYVIPFRSVLVWSSVWYSRLCKQINSLCHTGAYLFNMI